MHQSFLFWSCSIPIYLAFYAMKERTQLSASWQRWKKYHTFSEGNVTGVKTPQNPNKFSKNNDMYHKKFVLENDNQDFKRDPENTDFSQISRHIHATAILYIKSANFTIDLKSIKIFIPSWKHIFFQITKNLWKHILRLIK